MKYFFIILFLLLTFAGKTTFAATVLDEEGIGATDEKVAEGDSSNQLASSICQLILLLNGRIGRAIAIIALFAIAILMATGKVGVPIFLTFLVGIAMLFGAKSIALVLLPSFVEVREIDRLEPVKRSPEELIKQVCPELK